MRRVVFSAAYGLGRACERAAQVLFHVAAGATRLDDLRGAIRRQWDEAGQIAWDPYTYSGLLAWEQRFYSTVLHPGERLLVVGCGTGRELVALLEGGFAAEGIDVAPECVRIAREALATRGLSAPVQVAAIEDFVPAAPFDAVIFATMVYSLVPQADRRVAMLRRLARHLAPGGRIVVTYIPRAGRPPRPALVKIARAAGAVTGADWRPEYGDVLIPAGGGRAFTYFEHRFALDEIAREIEQAGLRIAAHEHDDEGKLVAVP